MPANAFASPVTRPVAPARGVSAMCALAEDPAANVTTSEVAISAARLSQLTAGQASYSPYLP